MSDAILCPYPSAGITEERVKELIKSTPGMGSTITSILDVTPSLFTWNPYPMAAKAGVGNPCSNGGVWYDVYAFSDIVYDTGVKIAIINNTTLSSSFANVTNRFSVSTSISVTHDGPNYYNSWDSWKSSSATVNTGQIQARIVNGIVTIRFNVLIAVSYDTNSSATTCTKINYSGSAGSFTNMDQNCTQLTLQLSY